MKKKKRIVAFLGLSFLLAGSARSQELFVSTEPASNMPAGSLGARMNARLYKMLADGSYTYRLDPELMFGLSKKVMIHLNAYGSDMYKPEFRFEGAGVYAKYRFYSSDEVHSHFRMAAFGKVSLINNPNVLVKQDATGGGNGGGSSGQPVTNYYPSDEIDLDGSNSGYSAGVVATKLIYKTALSGTVHYTGRWDNPNAEKYPGQSAQALNYSLSAGYLLLPRQYRDYRQTNVNLYCEWLAATALDKNAWYLDIAPAVQFIFNSIARLDLSYRTQLTGNMVRLSHEYLLLRFEYNFLGILKSNK